ncbi:hypothetical protein [Blastococcus haudaquaticus]|uniref:Uncharacterized protein n=1 Tax=Blastococcus haudaquaticus TaxID=1938745 RepID=A0A286GGQ5_9ACTN|nr:hypothetical protein [Blastococcus haudaquaticus]SOD94703.1 hypothetical protein SAMN06272739_0964 [Blastococcus haudaquaticus]
MNSALFVTEGVSTNLIGSGEPRLRRYRGSDSSWFTRAAEFVRRLRPASARVPVLSR